MNQRSRFIKGGGEVEGHKVVGKQSLGQSEVFLEDLCRPHPDLNGDIVEPGGREGDCGRRRGGGVLAELRLLRRRRPSSWCSVC